MTNDYLTVEYNKYNIKMLILIIPSQRCISEELDYRSLKATNTLYYTVSTKKL